MREELHTFDSSDAVAESVKINNGSASSTRILSFKDFPKARDYLITSLILNNGSRAGAVANMTLKELDLAVAESRRYVVSVMHHKTVSSAAPADLAFTDDLYRLIRIYVQKIRNKLPGIDVKGSSKVFCVLGRQVNVFLNDFRPAELLFEESSWSISIS